MGKAKRKIIINTSDTTFEDLLKIEQSEARNTSSPNRLSLDRIHIADQVFQVRRDYGDNPEFDRGHIIGLIDAIENTGALDPICVTAIGSNFYLIDGHHRYFAYKSAGWDKAVPVCVFSGSLAEAEAKAGEENHKNKLPVSKENKLEHAWKLTRRDIWSIAELTVKTGCASRTISYMRAKRKELLEQGLDPWDYTWKGIKQDQTKSESFDRDQWIEEKSNELARAIGADPSYKILKWPEVLAEAIRKVSPELPRKLVEQWHDIAEEVVSFETDNDDINIDSLDI